MNQKAAPTPGERTLDPQYQPGPAAIQEQRTASPRPAAEVRASREMVSEHSSWILPLKEEVGRIISTGC
jgi:hypothetical protein